MLEHRCNPNVMATEAAKPATASFEEFAGWATPALLRLATTLTGDRNDAWDLTQDTLFRLFRSWHRVRSDGHPMAYARTTMVRLNLNRLRSARRELATHLRKPPTPEHTDEAFFADLEPWLAGAIARLPRQQRAALVLCHLLDWSVQEAADAMNCRRTTVKTHLARGLKALRAAAVEQKPKESSP